MNGTESAENASRALNRSAAWQAPGGSTGVVAVLATGQLWAITPEAEKLTSIRAADAIGQHFDILPLGLRQLVDEALHSEAAVRDRPIKLNTEIGSTALQSSTIPLLSVHGEIQGLVIILSPLGTGENLNPSMERLDRLASIGTLSASMAHEIKNALVAISTFVNDLVIRNKDAELADLAAKEFRRIDSIVSQMLKFAGPAKPAFAPVSLHGVLDHSLQLIEPELRSRGLRLNRSFRASPDTVEGDDYQLEQAFLNVFLNAVAAMNPGGQLSVSTELVWGDGADSPPNLQFVQVSIQDTGSGIPPEIMARIFEPFFSTKSQGTGLGLAITRRIILEHRGTLRVESEFQKGTTFLFCFPLPVEQNG